MSSLIEAIQETGKSVPFGGNRPLILDDPTQVWWVRTGYADLFTVRREPGGGLGQRAFVTRVEEHGLVMGARVEKGAELTLMAAGGVESTLIQFPLSQLLAWAREQGARSAEALALIETWIGTISAGMVKQLPPKNAVEAPPQGELAVEAGGGLHGEKLVWVTPQSGVSRFMGQPDLPPINPGAFFPLANHTWLLAVDACRYRFIDSTAVLSGGKMESALAAFHAVAVKGLGILRVRAEDRERKRLLDKEELNRHNIRGALEHLSGIMNPEHRQLAEMEEEANQTLLVCRAVGKMMGLTIRVPPNLPGSGHHAGSVRRVANASRFRMRTVVLKGEWWNGDHGPLVAFLEEDGRPVALLPRKRSRYEIFDPKSELRTRVTPEIAQTLRPFAEAFYRPFPEKPLKGFDLLKFSFAGSTTDLVMVMLMGALGGLLGIAIPVATGIIFDDFIPAAERMQLGQIALGMVVAALAIGVFQVTRGYAMMRLSIRMGLSTQAAAWDRLLKLPANFFRKFEAGDLAARVNGIDAIRRNLSTTTINGILSSIFTIFNLALIFSYSPELAWVGFLLVFFVFLTTLAAGYGQLRFQRKLMDGQGLLTGLVYQLINGIAKLRISGAENRAFALWAKKFSEDRQITYDATRFLGIMGVFNLSYPLFTSMVIYAAMLNLSNGAVTTGRFLAFNAAFLGFLNGVLTLGESILSLMNIAPLYERAKPVLTSDVEISESRQDPGILRGKIEATRVSFRYTDDGPLILSDVSFSIKPGEFVALVGPSGGGKSTMLRLLMGFETPNLGALLYDDQPLKDLDLLQVRRQIGVVLQNGRLMPGDIYTNIVGSSNLTVEDAWEAARMAGLAEDLEQMPMGMHTVVSEGGSTLSGGQRQRLLIARAIVKRPRILFFDEATSALDNKTQAIVSRSIEKLQATRVVIAHRLSTIRQADRILTFAGGRLAQSGTYDELVNQPGPFQELARRQIV